MDFSQGGGTVALVAGPRVLAPARLASDRSEACRLLLATMPVPPLTPPQRHLIPPTFAGLSGGSGVRGGTFRPPM